MQLTQQQFHQNLLAAVGEAASPTLSDKKEYKFVIAPVHEPNAKYNSTDEYLRVTLLDNKNTAGRLFDSQEVAAFLAGPNSSFPLWIDVVLKGKYANYYLVELKTSMRFRKTSELNKETGYPPFRRLCAGSVDG